MSGNLFNSAFWPSDCIYNIQCESGGQMEGCAEIEHHFKVDNEENIWIQKRKQKEQDREQSVLDYAEFARTRCSGSD